MKHPLRRRWMFVAFVAVRAVVRWFPLGAAQALGRVVGLGAYGFMGRSRALCLAHLRYALGPSVSARTCHRIARGVFINLAKNALEWCVLDRLFPRSIRRLVDVQGLHHLQRALEQGRGAIILSPHFGNWELLAMAITSLGFPGGVLARRLRYPEYEPFLVGLRSRTGVKTLARGSLTEAARLLRANQLIGALPDQDIDSLEGVFVDFFDHPTYTPVGPAALSLMTHAPIVPCFIVRRGWRFRIHIEAPITVAGQEDRTQALLDLTQAWSRVVESYIRRYPDQWVWMHRRWKTQPSTQHTAHSTQNRTETEREVQPIHAVAGAVVGCLLSAVCCLLVFGGCAKSSSTPHAPTAEEDLATRQMDSFTIAGYAPDGRKRWDLEGAGATAEGTMVTIQRPHAIGYDLSDRPAGSAAPAGQAQSDVVPRTVYLEASVALIDQKSRRVRLEHDVTIHTSDGLWLTSPVMYWLPDQQELLTDEPVRIETGHMLLRGRGAVGRSQLKTADLHRDVELVLNPSSRPQAGARPGEQSRRAGEPSHVTITCDGPLAFDDQRGVAVFKRNVHINDAQGDLYSDTLIAYVDRATRLITYADALGRVRITQGSHVATGERAVYEPDKTKVTLLGSPSLWVYPDGDRAPGIPPASQGAGMVAHAAPSSDGLP